MYICSIFLSGFIDVCVQTLLKCNNGRTDFIPEMLNPNGNSIEDYRAAIGLYIYLYFSHNQIYRGTEMTCTINTIYIRKGVCMDW
jgi:hypothetical protein